MSILRQSTAATVRVGSFVDSTDGVTPETGVTLGAADQAELMKAGGGASVDVSGRTWAAVTGADGWYDLTLTTTDTNTVGDVTVVVQDASLCLPVLVRFQVVEEAVYDILYASGATGATTLTAAGLTAVENEILDAALSGHTTAGTVGAFFNLLDDIESDTSTFLANITISAINATVDAALADIRLDELVAASASAPVSGSLIDAQNVAITDIQGAGFVTGTDSLKATADALAALNDLSSADVQAALTAQGYTVARAAFLDNLDATISSIASAVAALNNLAIADVQTALTNQGYTPARAVFLDNLDATISSIASAISGLNDPTAAVIADQVWVELIADHSGTSGSTAEALAAAAAGGAGLTQQQVRDALKLAPTAGSPAAGSVDAELDSIIAAIAALNDLSSADVQAALTSQGYTVARAGNLDNLDVASSTLATAAALAALNDLSSADVQAALTAQGLTTVRAALLDNLDAAITTLPTAAEIETEVLDALLSGHTVSGSVGEALGLISTLSTAASIAALNDLSSADVTAVLDAQGYTAARAVLLDNLDVASSTLATASALAAAATEQTTVRKIMTNRIHVDPGTGVLTIYDDDDSTPLLTANIWSNVGGSIAYVGTAAIARRDKLA